MAITQGLDISTMHSHWFNKSFCWFSFLEKGNLFSSLFQNLGCYSGVVVLFAGTCGIDVVMCTTPSNTPSPRPARVHSEIK
jgi:hypothetical protein